MRRSFITFLTIGLLALDSYGQGCSDAGFCTMGAMRPDQAYSKRLDLKLRSIELNFYRGQSLQTTTIYAATVDATIGLNDRNYFQVKLPYQMTEGKLGSVSGLGDISLSYTTVLKASRSFTMSGTFGGKIPLGDGNETVNGKISGKTDAPAHMYYQPSLGSYDIVGGLSVINEKWLFATGIQIPLTRNNNQFTWGPFLDNTNEQDYIRKYDSGQELLRGIDVMLRVERNWRFTNYNFSLGLLPIWRIAKDNALTSESDFTEFVDMDGTTGLALSALASFGYNFDVNSSIKFIHGHKLADRDVNPDGLTRKTVNSVSYIYKF